MAKTPTSTRNTTNGDDMTNNNTTNDNTRPAPRSAFDLEVRTATDGDNFNLAGAADIGLKTLVAATCGVVLYKTFTGDSSSK